MELKLSFSPTRPTRGSNGLIPTSLQNAQGGLKSTALRKLEGRLPREGRPPLRDRTGSQTAREPVHYARAGFDLKLRVFVGFPFDHVSSKMILIVCKRTTARAAIH